MRTPETRLHGQGNSLLPGLIPEAIASNVRPAVKTTKTINQLIIIIIIIKMIIKHSLLTISFV